MIYKDTLTLVSIDIDVVIGFELLGFVIKNDHGQALTGIICYRPPVVFGVQQQQLLLETFTNMAATHHRLVILGDFILWLNGSLDSGYANIHQSCEGLGLFQQVSKVTNKGGHLLDLIFSEATHLIIGEILPLDWTDHFLIKF